MRRFFSNADRTNGGPLREHEPADARAVHSSDEILFWRYAHYAVVTWFYLFRVFRVVQKTSEESFKRLDRVDHTIRWRKIIRLWFYDFYAEFL